MEDRTDANGGGFNPIATDIQHDFEVFSTLPRAYRHAIIEARYNYNADEATRLLNDIRVALSAGSYFPPDPNEVVSEAIRQIALNDAMGVKLSMEQKWKEVNSAPPIRPSSTRRNTPMRRTVRIAPSSATILNRLGMTLPSTSKSQPEPEFELFGPERSRLLKTPTIRG